MANRNFPSNKLYNSHVMPCMIDMQIAIGSSGAPTLSSAPFVQSVAHLATGVYQIQLKDNYFALLGMDASVISPVGSSPIDPHVGVVGDLYQISTVGNSDWATAGLPSSVTAAVGAVICLAAQPGAGTGRVKLISPSNIGRMELGSSLMNSNSPSQGNAIAGTNGAIVLVRTLDVASAPADPTSGSILQIALYLNNSSVQ